jgi:hypothetical protein
MMKPRGRWLVHRLLLLAAVGIFVAAHGAILYYVSSHGARLASSDRSGVGRYGRWTLLSSDDPGVANLGHHARHLVVEIVAVKCPAARIVGVKGDGDAAHRWHQNGIAHGTCERGAI